MQTGYRDIRRWLARRSKDAQPARPPPASNPSSLLKSAHLRESFRHLIVKFTPHLETAGGRRWSDLLVAEHIAGEVLRAHGQPAARSTYLTDSERAYLEVERFDRIGGAGRLGMVSLGALDDAFVDERLGWPQSVAALLRAGLIDADDARRLRWLSAFGSLIANTDMHLGNASFLYGGNTRLRLSPVYDMLPMLYAPVRDEIVDRAFSALTPTPAAGDQWHAALPAARTFWQMPCTPSKSICVRQWRNVARQWSAGDGLT